MNAFELLNSFIYLLLYINFIIKVAFYQLFSE